MIFWKKSNRHASLSNPGKQLVVDLRDKESRVEGEIPQSAFLNPKSRNTPYKSRAERDIARLLDQYRIPFVYEKPTAIVDSGKTRIYYPDFSLSYGLLIEYFGINGSRDYRERTKHKLKVYEQNQFEVIDLYPKDMNEGWQDSLLGRIDNTLEGRVNDYRGRTAGVHTGRPTYSTIRGY